MEQFRQLLEAQGHWRKEDHGALLCQPTVGVLVGRGGRPARSSAWNRAAETKAACLMGAATAIRMAVLASAPHSRRSVCCMCGNASSSGPMHYSRGPLHPTCGPICISAVPAAVPRPCKPLP